MVHISSFGGFSLSNLGKTIRDNVNRAIDSFIESTHIEGRYHDYDDYDDLDCDKEEEPGTVSRYDTGYEDHEYDRDFKDDDFADFVWNNPPKKAFLAYDKTNDLTTIKFYDNAGNKYCKKKVDGDRRYEYRNIILDNTTDEDLKIEDVIDVTLLNNGVKNSSNKKPVRKKSVKSLKPNAREQVARALVNMQNDKEKGRTFVRPIFPDCNDKDVDYSSFKTDYCLFELKLEELGSNFIIDPVFENLNSSLGKNVFNDDTVEEVLVGYKGTTLTLKTKDGLRAVLNFENGGRKITTANPNDGLDILLFDNRGPLIESDKKGK